MGQLAAAVGRLAAVAAAAVAAAAVAAVAVAVRAAESSCGIRARSRRGREDGSVKLLVAVPP